jgi:hypothetical protein
MTKLTAMLEKRMATYYLLLVDKGNANEEEFNLSNNEIRLPNVVIAYRVTLI